MDRKKKLLTRLMTDRLNWNNFWYCLRNNPDDKPLVFNVGLCKTGTSSFHQAMRELGWNPAHNLHMVLFPTHDRLPLEYESSQDEAIEWAKISPFNCFSDIPFCGGEDA